MPLCQPVVELTVPWLEVEPLGVDVTEPEELEPVLVGLDVVVVSVLVWDDVLVSDVVLECEVVDEVVGRPHSPTSSGTESAPLPMGMMWLPQSSP